MKSYIGNAFSLQMLQEFPCNVSVETVTPNEIPQDAMSCIGHADTANVVSAILGWTVVPNRISIKLAPGDTLFVAQLTGGRLPEGATTLPDGFSLTFLRVTVQ